MTRKPKEEPHAIAIDMRSVIDGPPTFVDACVEMQRAQMEFFALFEASWGRAWRESWDQWVCRWGGGVPIDV